MGIVLAERTQKGRCDGLDYFAPPARTVPTPGGSGPAFAVHVAVTEATMAIYRERRVIRHLVVKIEATKPAVSEMQFDLLA